VNGSVPSDFKRIARDLLRGKAERVTESRVHVLAILLGSKSALTHADVQQLVDGEADAAVDRVTIYRVLEWLTDAGLAHRIASTDRVFRFSATIAQQSHGHFHCSDCNRLFCVGAEQTAVNSSNLNSSVAAMLPKGFVSGDIDLTISGRCADCA
jgi:Fur family transcriptional regulator, ferric uptake regulator